MLIRFHHRQNILRPHSAVMVSKVETRTGSRGNKLRRNPPLGRRLGCATVRDANCNTRPSLLSVLHVRHNGHVTELNYLTFDIKATLIWFISLTKKTICEPDDTRYELYLYRISHAAGSMDSDQLLMLMYKTCFKSSRYVFTDACHKGYIFFTVLVIYHAHKITIQKRIKFFMPHI